MPIAALPEHGIHLLDSQLVITTPVQLVKELVENAIDAQATSVDVLISANTVDRIEVRDNGLGIDVGDFDALGRRGHTSKLRTFNELKRIGGTTLGFRGQALASANTLGKLSITTRTRTAPIASALHFGITGRGVTEKVHISAPVGTTVIVTNFLACMPVRERIAIRDCQKAAAELKSLLSAYALARPYLKLTLKQPRRVTPVWSYSPRPESGVREALVQIFGSDFASRCEEKTIRIEEPVSEPSGCEGTTSHGGQESQSFTIQACLPRPGADPPRKRSYVSVDSRPVSPARGTQKKLLSIFHASITKSRASYGAPALKDPFIQLNIKCPIGSYDPNVEPSKDDVIFVDDQPLLQAFEKLCEDMYVNSQAQQSPAQARDEVVGDEGEDSLASGNLGSAGSIPGSTQQTTKTERNHRPQRCTGEDKDTARESQAEGPWAVNMSALIDSLSDEDSEEESGCLRQVRPKTDKHGDTGLRTRPLEALNPWTIVKMKAPHRATSERQDSPLCLTDKHTPGRAAWTEDQASNETLADTPPRCEVAPGRHLLSHLGPQPVPRSQNTAEQELRTPPPSSPYEQRQSHRVLRQRVSLDEEVTPEANCSSHPQASLSRGIRSNHNNANLELSGVAAGPRPCERANLATTTFASAPPATLPTGFPIGGELRARGELSADNEPPRTHFSAADLRGRSMAEEGSRDEPRRIRQPGSDMRPVGTVLEGFKRQTLVQTVQITSVLILSLEGVMSQFDEYILTGGLAKAFNDLDELEWADETSRIVCEGKVEVNRSGREAKQTNG